jgi:hypothetical protein
MSEKKDGELSVLNDVLNFCRSNGGYKKKQTEKLAGSIDSERERPDLAIVRSNGMVIGIEHFRVDHHIGKGKKAESKSAKLAGQLEKSRKSLLNGESDSIDDHLFDKLARVVGGGCARYMQNRNNACCDDLIASLDMRLFDENAGHAQKLPIYKANLASRYGKAYKIELGYLIEVHSDFSGLFLTDRRRTKRLQVGECPLFEGVYDLLSRAAEDVDWILLAFCPPIGRELADAAIIDCKNGMFKASCAKQGLSRTAYFGLDKDESSRKQAKPGSLSIEAVDDRYEIVVKADVEKPNGLRLWRTGIEGAALAFNLRKRQEPFAATLPVQMVYEALLPEIRYMSGEITGRIVATALNKTPEVMARMDAFGERYGIFNAAKQRDGE